MKGIKDDLILVAIVSCLLGLGIFEAVVAIIKAYNWYF